MKKIEAIIVPGQLDAVRLELERRGINATLTLINVQQAEGPKASPHTEVAGAFADRLKLELIVGERQVQRAVDIITQYGQVALLKVNEALQIVPPLTNV
jgi:nitrogen regulatory protein PII